MYIDAIHQRPITPLLSSNVLIEFMPILVNIEHPFAILPSKAYLVSLGVSFMIPRSNAKDIAKWVAVVIMGFSPT